MKPTSPPSFSTGEATSSLDTVLQRRDTWRGRHSPLPDGGGLATGFSRLDSHLHEGGWPRGAISELYCQNTGIGELSLLLPSLSRLSRQGGSLFLVNPPYIPYAPALLNAGIALECLYLVHTINRQQLCWSAAEILADPGCGAVLCWFRGPVGQYKQLRKLQLAAAEGNSTGFLFRDMADRDKPSPAALRLSVQSRAGQLALHIHKQRGGSAGQQLSLPRHGPAALYHTNGHRPATGANLPLLPSLPTHTDGPETRQWH